MLPVQNMSGNRHYELVDLVAYRSLQAQHLSAWQVLFVSRLQEAVPPEDSLSVAVVLRNSGHLARRDAAGPLEGKDVRMALVLKPTEQHTLTWRRLSEQVSATCTALPRTTEDWHRS